MFFLKTVSLKAPSACMRDGAPDPSRDESVSEVACTTDACKERKREKEVCNNRRCRCRCRQRKRETFFRGHDAQSQFWERGAFAGLGWKICTAFFSWRQSASTKKEECVCDISLLSLYFCLSVCLSISLLYLYRTLSSSRSPLIF